MERSQAGEADGGDAGGDIAGQAPGHERQDDEQRSHEQAAEGARTDLRPLLDELIGVFDVQELGSGAGHKCANGDEQSDQCVNYARSSSRHPHRIVEVHSTFAKLEEQIGRRCTD